MIARNGKKPAFDIRDLITYDGPENDMIEAAYDTVNRTAIFIGDVPFGELYTQPWVKLALSCQIDEAQECGLLNDAEKTWDAFDVLEAAGLMSWSKYLNGDHYRDGDDDVTRAHLALRRQGLYLPHIYNKPNLNKKRANVLNDLVEIAPHITYKQLFSNTIADMRVLTAVRVGVAHEIPLIPANHKCCDVQNTGLCIPGTVDQICYICGGGSGSSNC